MEPAAFHRASIEPTLPTLVSNLPNKSTERVSAVTRTILSDLTEKRAYYLKYCKPEIGFIIDLNTGSKIYIVKRVYVSYSIGMQIMPEGSIYHGQFRISQGYPAHGPGMLEKEGFIFEGDWKQGMLKGKSTITTPSGDIYEGSWSNYSWLRNSEVTILYKNGNYYKGTFTGTKEQTFTRTGRGQLTTPTHKYDGHWVNDVFISVANDPPKQERETQQCQFPNHGVTAFRYNDGEYSVQWQNGKLPEGTFRSDFGNFYEGSFDENLVFHGAGKLSYSYVNKSQYQIETSFEGLFDHGSMKAGVGFALLLIGKLSCFCYGEIQDNKLFAGIGYMQWGEGVFAGIIAAGEPRKGYLYQPDQVPSFDDLIKLYPSEMGVIHYYVYYFNHCSQGPLGEAATGFSASPLGQTSPS